MRIVVTGASGFVGRALVRRLMANGYDVIALVRSAENAVEGAEYLIHDLGSNVPLHLPSNTDAVAHLAQSRQYRRFPEDADVLFRVNVLGTHTLLKAAAEAAVSCFSLVSSGSVYEPFGGVLLKETAALQPSGYLGATKLAAETIAYPYQKVFPVSILRLFNPYGPGQTGRLIPDLIHRVTAGVPVILPIEGEGMTFAPSYVDDVCDVIMESLVCEWTGHFNVASQETYTIEKLALEIGRAVGRKAVFERRDISAPFVVPDLERLGGRYDLGRFRPFSVGLVPTLVAEYPGNDPS